MSDNQTSAGASFDIDQYAPEGSVTSVDETERLKLARQVLIVMAIIIAGVFIGWAFAPDNAALKAIFELIKIGALPLITLIVSFYFPNANK